MLIIKRPLHRKEIVTSDRLSKLQAMTSASFKQTDHYKYPRRGLWRLLKRRVLHPGHMQWLRKLGLPGKCMRSCACLCVCVCRAGGGKASLYSSSSKRSQWPTKGSAWPLQGIAVCGGSFLLISPLGHQQLSPGTEWMRVSITWAHLLSYGQTITLPRCYDEVSPVHLVLILLTSSTTSA